MLAFFCCLICTPHCRYCVRIAGKHAVLIADSMFKNAQFMAKSLQERSVGPAIRRWIGVFALLRADVHVDVHLTEAGVSVCILGGERVVLLKVIDIAELMAASLARDTR